MIIAKLNNAADPVLSRGLFNNGFAVLTRGARDPLVSFGGQMKNYILFGLLIMISTGCVGLSTGRYPYPEGIEANPNNAAEAKIDRTDYKVYLNIEGYPPDPNFGLIGIIVPVIPMGQWKWLTGIGKDDLRIRVNAKFIPITKEGTFDTGTLKIVVNERQYVPSKIKKARGCVGENGNDVDIVKSFPIQEEVCITFIFSELRPPDTSFILMAHDLPDIKYVLKRKIRYELIIMN